jgi:hypothetical protein
MKEQLFLALLALFCINSYSQIVFENGYFINESNQKIDCLIKNIDWEYNPGKFEYKLLQDDFVRTAEIQDVNEFGIYGVSKYIKAKVKIDRSGNELDKMDYEKNPIFRRKPYSLKC